MVLTIVAVIVRILSNPLANVFQKQFTIKGHHPLLINFFTYLVLGFVSIFVALAVDWPVLGFDFWLYSILGGITGAVGNGFLVKALEKGDLSVLGPINSYKSVVGLVTGIFLLAEFPNVWGLMGTALIIFGSYFVLDTTEDRFTWALLKRKAIQFRIWAMVLTGIEAVFVKKVILATSTLISFFSWCWFGTFFALLFLLVEKRSMPATTARISWADAGRFLCLASCVALMVFTTAYTFQQMDVGYALALFQLSTLVSVILGFKIFREQDIRKKLLGSVIMIIGSVVIILMQDK